MEHHEALDVLGLRGRPAPDDVKRAYRRLARELHPDAGGDAIAFHRVREAYELLEAQDAPVGPAPQQRSASVDRRWWDAGSAWHEEPVDLAGVDVEAGRAALSGDGPLAMDRDRLIALLVGAAPVQPVRLHSRSPGSRLHRMISWLQPDLLATVTIAPATEGRRPGHDVDAEVRSGAGKGRRLLADASAPDGWTQARGSDTVRIARTMRPSRDPEATAIRVAREVDEALAAIGWPLGEWFLLRS